jgi:hypothetical protein
MLGGAGLTFVSQLTAGPNMQLRNLSTNPNARAWLLMIVSVAIHVVDEAMMGFLPFYNSSVAALRERFAFFPAPTFSFELWLGGLVAGILLCFGLTVSVARGGKVIRWAATILGVIMILNAVGHLAGSLYFGRVIPGAYSSPILLLSAIYVVFRGIRGDWRLTAKGSLGAA